MKILLLCVIVPTLAFGQTISEKRAALQGEKVPVNGYAAKELADVNGELGLLHEQLKGLHKEGKILLAQGASAEEYQMLLGEIGKVQERIDWIGEQWRSLTASEQDSEAYALWHQPWTSIEQLVIDYGSPDFVYIIPPEVGGIRISVSSSLPVPRESWDEVLTLLLTNHNVGIRQLNPFVRELYLTGQKPTSVSYVTDRREELAGIPFSAQVCFMLTVPLAHHGRAHEFVSCCSGPDVHILPHGQQIFLFSTPRKLMELLKLYDFFEEGHGERGVAILSTEKIKASEMAGILDHYFEQKEGERAFKVMPLSDLPNSLFVIAPSQEIDSIRRLMTELEEQVANPKERTVFTYTAKHSDPKGLAVALSQVYGLLLNDPKAVRVPTEKLVEKAKANEANLAINPKAVTTNLKMRKSELPEMAGNFVIYPKTGTIVMVVEQEFLPTLKALLRKIDIPKKMVRIDVLFFEKKIDRQSRFGLNLMQMQGRGKGVGARYENRGIFQFMVQLAKGSTDVPAYDLTYDFLLSQEDVRVNSNPSVTTVNQTPATIQLVEEISIDNGIVFTGGDRKDDFAKRAFTRTQYGIAMTITPTINSSWDDESGEEVHFITLETDVLFDTPRTDKNNDRPPVLRRRVTNEVRVGDGETVVLGGLRSKMQEDSSSALPFLGEIPGLGKFFGSSTQSDRDTEMFIFITPHIIDDPSEEARRAVCQDACRRPGDTQEYLQRVLQARTCGKQQLFDQTLKAIFGRGYPCNPN